MKKKSALFILIFICAAASAHAAVTGKASFSGTAPAPETIDMGADPTCAAANAGPVSKEDVVVNANGTLKNVFVYVKSGLEGKTFEPKKEPATLSQKGCHYVPHVFGVQVGQTLEIHNEDATLHNVHGLPKQSKEFNLGMPIQGMKLNRKFDKAEVPVKFKCDVHPWMSAYAGVVDNPFFAVTKDDGSFEIKDLPAGKYTLEAWHEKFGTKTMEITVDASGNASADFAFQG